MDVEKLFGFVFFYLTLKPPRQDILHQYFGLSFNTIVDWSNFIREVFIHYSTKDGHFKIGGPNIIVEIDEAKMGKRKYGRGRIIEGTWVFGGIDRSSKEIFLIPVKRRNTRTLMKLIKRHIRPGTTIMSDCWAAYRKLGTEEMFTHMTVNHSINFVDPDTGAHTQNIERSWREVRANIPKYGRRKVHFAGYLAEYLFKRKFPDFNIRIHEFYRAAAQLYDVYNGNDGDGVAQSDN